MALYLGAPPWRDGEGGRRCLVREGCAPLTLRSARGVAPGCSRVLADASSPPPAVSRGGGREAWLRRRRVGGRTMRAALHRPPAPSARRPVRRDVCGRSYSRGRQLGTWGALSPSATEGGACLAEDVCSVLEALRMPCRHSADARLWLDTSSADGLLPTRTSS